MKLPLIVGILFELWRVITNLLVANMLIKKYPLICPMLGFIAFILYFI